MLKIQFIVQLEIFIQKIFLSCIRGDEKVISGVRLVKSEIYNRDLRRMLKDAISIEIPDSYAINGSPPPPTHAHNSQSPCLM